MSTPGGVPIPILFFLSDPNAVPPPQPPATEGYVFTAPRRPRVFVVPERTETP